MDKTQAEQGMDIMAAILARSASNFEFRRQLLNDPRSAIAESIGVETSDLPETLALNFTEEPGNGAVVLPEYVGEAELAEAELDAVSGGSSLVCIGIAAGVITAIDWYREDR